MANPSWSTDNITFHTLPGAYRFGGKPRSRVQSNVALESDSGVEFVYEKFTKRTLELIFRVTGGQLDAFDTFDSTVNGEVGVFYFSLSGAGAADSFQAKKEPSFDPAELDQPNRNTGDVMFDYTLRIRSLAL